jgi:hypothetical protein
MEGVSVQMLESRAEMLIALPSLLGGSGNGPYLVKEVG